MRHITKNMHTQQHACERMHHGMCRPTHNIKSKAELLELVRKHKHGLLQEEVCPCHTHVTPVLSLCAQPHWSAPLTQVEDAYARVLEDLMQLRADGDVVVVYSMEAGASMVYPVTGGMQAGKVRRGIACRVDAVGSACRVDASTRCAMRMRRHGCGGVYHALTCLCAGG